MKRRRVWIAAAAGLVLIAALGLFLATRPSQRGTAAFFSRHQALLEDFLRLCRAEAEQHNGEYRLDAVYTDWLSGVLMCHLNLSAPDGEREFPASPELTAAWEELEGYGYFTSVGCSFDENGAVEIHFSTKKEWIPYGEPTQGHYCQVYCLLWRDADYQGWPLEGWWHPLDPPGWYYTCHKHYDG